MNGLYPQNWLSYLGVLSIFLRFLGLFLLVPAFSHRSVPPLFKILFALVLSLAFYPILKWHLPILPTSVAGLVGLVARETVVGFLMGFVMFITFEGIHLAAQFMGYQMGFGTVGLIDPVNHSQVSVLVPLHGWMALMVFFFTDMHHHVLQLFFMSFEITRDLNASIFANPELVQMVIGISAKLFVIALKIAAPLTVLLLGCNIAIGIVSRMLPQMHVILFSFPLTILLGLTALYIFAPDLIGYFESLILGISGDVLGVLRTL